jgi:hypothetical protein
MGPSPSTRRVKYSKQSRKPHIAELYSAQKTAIRLNGTTVRNITSYIAGKKIMVLLSESFVTQFVFRSRRVCFAEFLD